MELKYWEIVLKKSNKKRTIPFIIGSKKFLHLNSNYDEVEEFFNEIINSETDESYSMYHCSEIGEYVIFRNPSNQYLMEGVKIKNPKTDKIKLVFGMNMSLFGTSYNEIVINLSKRYRKHIDNEDFSFIDRCFSKYSDIDKKEINSYFGL